VLGPVEAALRRQFTDPGVVLGRAELMQQLQASGFTAGTARHAVTVCPWLHPAGRGQYRLAGQPT